MGSARLNLIGGILSNDAKSGSPRSDAQREFPRYGLVVDPATGHTPWSINIQPTRAVPNPEYKRREREALAFGTARLFGTEDLS